MKIEDARKIISNADNITKKARTYLGNIGVSLDSDDRLIEFWASDKRLIAFAKWLLPQPDTTWIKTIADILKGYNLTADPRAVRAEMERAHDSLDDLCAAKFVTECRKAAGLVG